MQKFNDESIKNLHLILIIIAINVYAKKEFKNIVQVFQQSLYNF